MKDGSGMSATMPNKAAEGRSRIRERGLIDITVEGGELLLLLPDGGHGEGPAEAEPRVPPHLGKLLRHLPKNMRHFSRAQYNNR